MTYLKNSLETFIHDEAGYDLVEFALAAALAGSVGVMALRTQSPERTRAIACGDHMTYLKNSLETFIHDEAGYDLVEFALAAALAGSVGVMALRTQSPEFARAIDSLMSHF